MAQQAPSTVNVGPENVQGQNEQSQNGQSGPIGYKPNTTRSFVSALIGGPSAFGLTAPKPNVVGSISTSPTQASGFENIEGLVNQNGQFGPIGSGVNGNGLSNSRIVLPNNQGGSSLYPVIIPERPKKFNGVNFKVWQQKMLFYLTSIQQQRFLKEDPPMVPEGVVDPSVQQTVDAWNHSNFLC